MYRPYFIKIIKIWLIFVIINLILGWMQNGNFFSTAHEKSYCDSIGGTIKRLVYKTTLQRPFDNQILTSQSMYTFWKSNIKGIHFIYVHSNEVNEEEKKLVLRYAKAIKIPGIRS